VSVARKSLTVAAVFVAAMAVTGTAIGATHYIITSLSQISPSVVKQLKGATGPRGPAGPAGPAGQGAGFVANGSNAELTSTAGTIVTLPLAKAPAVVTASVTITDEDALLDDEADCSLKLDGKDIAPPVVLDLLAETTPLNNPKNATTTFAAAVTTPGTITLVCLDPNDSTAESAQGNITAVTVGSVTSVAQPSPSASASPTASASASPSASTSPSASATPTPSATSTGLLGH
jgi:hypothetical protein